MFIHPSILSTGWAVPQALYGAERRWVKHGDSQSNTAQCDKYKKEERTGCRGNTERRSLPTRGVLEQIISKQYAWARAVRWRKTSRQRKLQVWSLGGREPHSVWMSLPSGSPWPTSKISMVSNVPRTEAASCEEPPNWAPSGLNCSSICGGLSQLYWLQVGGRVLFSPAGGEVLDALGPEPQHTYRVKFPLFAHGETQSWAPSLRVVPQSTPLRPTELHFNPQFHENQTHHINANHLLERWVRRVS